MTIDRHNIDKDMGAAVAAVSLNIGNALFKDIPDGDLFRFAHSHELFVKRNGKYREFKSVGGRWFKTGQRTAVFRV